LRGLPTIESSGKLAEPKTLFDSVALDAEPVCISAGGVASRDVVPMDPGDLRELAFNGSAEC
jgi:hypothetical protein